MFSLKITTRCHSVRSLRSPVARSRQVSEVAIRRFATRSPEVRLRISGSAPRLPTRMTLLMLPAIDLFLGFRECGLKRPAGKLARPEGDNKANVLHSFPVARNRPQQNVTLLSRHRPWDGQPAVAGAHQGHVARAFQRGGGHDALLLQEQEVRLVGAVDVRVRSAHGQELDAHGLEVGGALLQGVGRDELVILERAVLLRDHVIADAGVPGRRGPLGAGGERERGAEGEEERLGGHGPHPSGGMTQLAAWTARVWKDWLSPDASTLPVTSRSVCWPQRP